VTFQAIQLYVRGFGDFYGATATTIIKKLEEIGFQIRSASDGRYDTLGGALETHFTETSELIPDNLDDIRPLTSRNCATSWG
jgi:hypothetical protein